MLVNRRDMKDVDNGITLIALVITIIILLILAGVTINIIINGGLIDKSQNATEKYKQAETEELESLDNALAKMNSINMGGNKVPQAGEIIESKDNINYTADGKGEKIPVPKGFSYAGEGTKETGFVIKNDLDGNEFVWIPTDLVPYQTYDWNKGLSATEFTEYYLADQTQNAQIIQEITNSVNMYQGYYISRYEAGTITKRTSKAETNQEQLPIPILKATTVEMPIYAYNYIDWNDAIYIGNNLYSKAKNNVTSRLINARGWNTALKFIETIGEDADKIYPIDSTGKGWYTDNIVNNSNYEIGKPLDIAKSNKLKNIFDLAGNMWEWTADRYKQGNYMHNAGSSYSYLASEYPAANHNVNEVDLANSNHGARLALYL